MKNFPVKLLLVYFCLLIITHTTSAQTVDVLNASGYQSPVKNSSMAWLNPAMDTTAVHFVALIKATGSGKKSDIEQLYLKLQEKALELGANAFRLKDYTKADDTNPSTLVLDTYYATDSALKNNFQQVEKNVVYIFGDADKSNKVYSFKINGEKKEIQGGHFYKQVLVQGQELKINKGGFAGATLWLNWKENRPPTYLTLSGFGLGGSPPPPGVMGASFNTGRINLVHGGLGPLLVQVLKQQE